MSCWRRLRISARRIRRDEDWRSLARWSLLVALIIVGLAALVVPLQRPPPPTTTDTADADSGTLDAEHPLDPLIARTAREIMPPKWDWRLLKAMVKKESGYDPRAESPGGAVGLTQLLPATARHLGLRAGEFFDAGANLAAGTRYLRSAYDRFSGVPDQAPQWLRTRLAIAGYNAGPGRAKQAYQAGGTDWSAISRHLPDSTVHHVERIVDEFYPRFDGVDQPRHRPAIGRWSPRLRFFHSDRVVTIDRRSTSMRLFQPPPVVD